MGHLRAILKLFQTIEDGQQGIPTAARISNNSFVIISALSSGIIDVYTRPCITAKFAKSETSYLKHQKKKSQVTALALQDGGAQAVSGDDQGFLHVWLTNDPTKCTWRQCGYGPVVDVAISNRYILASFKGIDEKDGCMLLLNKGLNIEDDWEKVKVYKPGRYTKCALSEILKLKELNVVYYLNKSLIYEKNPQDADDQPFSSLEVTKPFFVCRNPACLTTMVFAALVQRQLMLWDPKRPAVDGKNPFYFNLKSSEPVAFNKTSSISSVCDGHMFILTILENTLSVVTLEKEIKPKPKGPITYEEKDNPTKHTVFHAVRELVNGNPEPVDRIMAEVDGTDTTEMTSNSRTAIIGEETPDRISETPPNSKADNESSIPPDTPSVPVRVVLKDETPEMDRSNVPSDSPSERQEVDVEPKEVAGNNATPTATEAEPGDERIPNEPFNVVGQDDSIIVSDGEDNEEEVEEDPEGMGHEFWGLF
ncbi:unnamed protein product [Agarophyton chilense]|eukprot:gb/GEZJ01000023.1/.p5 GENE.gb/GEZJ01000023.1/~~gb/GEZJ01000023.1/.p5  ORF type:complete len:479 (+),score=62.15 gb/GEZJ01000023.1/:13680-15116(+)